jgi:hypothetical protein
MKKIIFLFAIISIGLSSCKKEQVTPADLVKPNQNTANSAKSLHCSPWEDVADAAAAAVDLNQVGVCNTSVCSSGTPTYFNLNNKIVKNASGATVYFLHLATVTIADQNAIWSNAVTQAIAATPTGYSLSNIHNFRTEAAGGPILMYLMRFDITYIKCTGGGGGGES